MSLTDAVQALRAAGLSGNDFDRVHSHTHETWLVGHYVIRLAGPGGSERLTSDRSDGQLKAGPLDAV